MSEVEASTLRTVRAFTLVEVLAALVILALLAGLTGVSLHGVLRKMNGEQLSQRILAFDRQARARAARFDRPIKLIVRERSMQQVAAAVTSSRNSKEAPPVLDAVLAMPSGWWIDRVLTAQVGAPESEITIAASASGGRGQSHSYGLRVMDSHGASFWIVFCGPTGQGSVIRYDKQAEDIFATLAQPRLARADAD